jgi:hypothetical protein
LGYLNWFIVDRTSQEILTGKDPFEEIENALEIIHAVRAEKKTPNRPQCLSEQTRRNRLFWTAMRQCWVYDPEQRAGADDVLKALRQAVQDQDNDSEGSGKGDSLCCNVV